MTDPLIPNAELVARAWLLAAVSRLGGGNVATTLPDPPWINNEFAQIMQVGGTPDRDNPISQPVVSVNCFAMKEGSRQPPWGQANHLAMLIWQATYVKRWSPSAAVELTLPEDYGRAIVQTVTAVSEPKRIPSDPSQYAVYNIDLQFYWLPASLVVS